MFIQDEAIAKTGLIPKVVYDYACILDSAVARAFI